MNYFEEQEYTKRFDLGLWKKLLKYARPYTRQLIVLALIMVGAAVIDVVFPLATRYAIDRFIIPGKLNGLAGYSIVYGLLILIQVLNTWLLIKIAGKIEVWLVYDIRKAGFKRLQELSFSYYDKTPVGWMMARMTSDSERLGEAISWGLVDLTWGLCHDDFHHDCHALYELEAGFDYPGGCAPACPYQPFLPGKNSRGLPAGAENQLQNHRRFQ